MNKGSWLVSFALVTLFCVAQAQDTVRVLDPYGRIITKIIAPAPLPEDTSKTLTVKEAAASFMTMEAFNYYEVHKVDKTVSFYKSALIPGLGFSDLGESNKTILFLLLGGASFIFAVTADDPATIKVYFMAYSIIRIFEFAQLSSSVDEYNRSLRVQMQLKFNLK